MRGQLGQFFRRKMEKSAGESHAARTLPKVRGVRVGSQRGEIALLFLRLYRALDALVGGDDAKARDWLRAANDHLAGVPAERIRTVEGLVDVVQYLDAMRGRL